jgi:hypothetical protein
MTIDSDLRALSRDGAIPHVCLATGQIVAEVAREGETIREFVDRTGWEDGPPIVVYEIGEDGKRLARLRAEWHRPIAPERTVLVSAPLGGGGGGGSQILSVVAMIALMVVANVVAGPIAGALGMGAMAVKIIAAIIVVGGGLLISHFMRPKADRGPRPVNDFMLSGNMARPGQPIPVQYGRLKFNPDFSDAPYTDYAGISSVYHAVMCLGVGEFDIHEFGVNDTAIWDSVTGLHDGFTGAVSQGRGAAAGGKIPDVAWQIVGPGEAVTLFATNIQSSGDVSGQTLPDPWGSQVDGGVILVGPNGEHSGEPNYLGWFPVNAPGTVAQRLAIDVAWPSGHYQTSESGEVSASITNLLLEIRKIDDQGHALGAATVLLDGSPTNSAGHELFKSRGPWRKTFLFDLPTAGRYEARLARKQQANKTRVVNAAAWIGCRAYCEGPTARPHVTQIALQATADKLLSGFNAGKFYVVATRRIPVWDAGAAAWAPQASRNPVWAACDLWADTRYGAGRPRDDLDMPTMIRLAADADARGDSFDHRYASHQGAIEALAVALQSIRAQPLPLWNKLSAVRDEPRSLPRLHLTDFEIIRGSFRATHRFAAAIVSDAVVGQYLDETTWRMAEVSSVGTVAGLQNPTRVMLQGVTKRAQAYDNVVYLDRVNRYRRSSYSFEVEGEGKLVKRGDLVRVATELPGSWGGSFRVESYLIPQRRLTLHADADWTKTGQRYITLKMRTGAPFGPVKCSKGPANNQVILSATDLALVETQQATTLADVLYRTDVSERPSASLSVGAPQEFLGLVHEVEPGSVEGHIRLSLTPYAASQIYATLAPLPAVPMPPTLVLPLVPGNISGIGASLLQEGTTLTLRAVWQPDRGSESYEAQYSADAGESWQACYAGASAQFEVAGFSGSDLSLRVRGVRGAQRSVSWSQVSVVAPAIVNTLDNLGLTVEVDAAIAGALIEGLAPINATLSANSSAIAAASAADDDLRRQIMEESEAAQLAAAIVQSQALTAARDAMGAASRAAAAIAETREVVTDGDRRAASDRLVVAARFEDTMAAVVQVASASADRDRALAGTVDQIAVAYGGDTQEIAAILAAARAREDIRPVAGDAARALAGIDETRVALAEVDASLSSVSTVLVAQIADSRAAWGREVEAQATINAARVQDVSSLTTAVADNTTAILAASAASSDRDQALAGRLDQIAVAYGGDAAELAAVLAAAEARRAGEAARQTAAQALAGVEAITTVVAETGRALVSDREVMAARVGAAEAAQIASRQVLVEADAAISQRIDTLTGVVSGNFGVLDGRVGAVEQVQATDRAVAAGRADTLTAGMASGDEQVALATALAAFAAGQMVGQVRQTANIALAGVQQSAQAMTDLSRSVADVSTVMTARFADQSADYTARIQAQADGLGALAASVVGISATSSAGTAGGRIQFVTASSPGSGVQAAYDLQVSGTAGGVFSAAGLRVQYNTDGTTAIVLSADRFFVEAGAARQTVFVANGDGFTLAGVTRFGSTVRSTATNGDGSPKWQIKPTGEIIATDATISGVIKGATLDVGEALRFAAGAQLRSGQLPWPYAFFDYLHEFYVDPSLAVQRVGISSNRIGLAMNIAALGIDSITAASLDADRKLMAPVGAGDGTLGAWLMPDGTFRKTASLTTLPTYAGASQGEVHPLVWDPDFTLQPGFPKTLICWARGEDEILTIPAGVSSLTLKLWGGGGSRPGNSTRTAGAGGAVQLTISVAPGDKLRITVGLGGCFGDARTFGYWSGASAPHVDSPINGYARAGKGIFNATPLQTASGGGATIVSRINADKSETILGIAGGGGAASTSADGTPGGPAQAGVTGGAGGVNGASCTANGQGAGGGGGEGGALGLGGTNFIVAGATATQSVAGSGSAPPLTADAHYQEHLTRMNFLSGAPARRAPGYGAATGRPPIGPLVAAGGDIMNGGSSAIGLYYGAQPGSAGLAILIFN